MGALVASLVSLALLCGFLILTGWEARRGTRFFAAERSALDGHVSRAAFIAEHVDLAAYARAEFARAMARVGHMVAGFTLELVRTAERFLARLVRRMRMRHELSAPTRPSSRAFVQTLSEFKGRLHDTRPEGIDKPLV